MMLREGMFLADRYEIIEQIGTGGMAEECGQTRPES